MAEARFYGLLILATTVAVSAMVWIEDRSPSPGVAFLLCFLASGLLVSSHFLGLISSGVLVCALFVSKLPTRTRWAAIGGTLSSWSFFLIYLKAIRAGSQNFSWIMMPTVLNSLRFYFHSPTEERFANGVIIVFLVASFVLCFRRSPELLVKPDSRRMLLIISVLFLLLPAGFYVVSHLYHPLFVGRYLMPYSLGFGCMLACALWYAGRQDVVQRQPGVIVALRVGLLCIVGVLHFLCLSKQPVRPLSDIQAVVALHPSLPLVIPNDAVFYQVRYYGGASGANTFFPIPSSRSGYLALLARQGYAPGVVSDADFLEQHKQFLYLDFPIFRDFYLRALASDPKWVAEEVGVVEVQGLPVHLFRIEYK